MGDRAEDEPGVLEDEENASQTQQMDHKPSQQEIDYAEAREFDRLLPIANISRIMKTALPENAKVAKDAKECIQECVSEFIAFITSEGRREMGE